MARASTHRICGWKFACFIKEFTAWWSIQAGESPEDCSPLHSRRKTYKSCFCCWAGANCSVCVFCDRPSCGSIEDSWASGWWVFQAAEGEKIVLAQTIWCANLTTSGCKVVVYIWHANILISRLLCNINKMHTNIIKFALLLLYCAHTVSAACQCDGQQCTCCVQPYQGSLDACVDISSDGDYDFVVTYGGCIMNMISFQNAQDISLISANCATSSDIGWCILITGFTANHSLASGNITSTFSFGGNVQQMWQGFFQMKDSNQPPARRPPTNALIGGQKLVESYVQPSALQSPSQDPSAACNQQCKIIPGCTCGGGNCYCCSSHADSANNRENVCAQLVGITDIQFLQSYFYFNSVQWMVTVVHGNKPQSVCSNNPSISGKVVCLTFNNLSFTTKNIVGGVSYATLGGGSANVTAIGSFSMWKCIFLNVAKAGL